MQIFSPPKGGVAHARVPLNMLLLAYVSVCVASNTEKTDLGLMFNGSLAAMTTT